MSLEMGNKGTQLLAAMAAVAVLVVGVVALGGLTGSDPSASTVSSSHHRYVVNFDQRCSHHHSL